jgi:hypothetical protein
VKRLYAVLAVLAAGACGRARDVVDLGPRTGWHAEGIAAVRADGRISLTADGKGYVWKVVSLDVDRYPALLVRTGQTLPRSVWRVEVQRGSEGFASEGGAMVVLEKQAEEGGYIVRLRDLTGWRGRVTFALYFSIEGRAGDWVELADLEAVHLTDLPPAAPRLTLPSNGDRVAFPALHYEWRQAPNAVAYDLEVSQSPAFRGADSVRVLAPYLADKLPYLPTDPQLPPPNQYRRPS